MPYSNDAVTVRVDEALAVLVAELARSVAVKFTHPTQEADK